MPVITCSLGLLLIILGVVCRVISDSPSVTVLVPAILGAAFLVAGLIGLLPKARKHAMHGAATLAVLAIAGSAGGLTSLPALLSGAEVERPLAVIARSLTFFLCLIFVALAVRSFRAARRARQQATVQP